MIAAELAASEAPHMEPVPATFMDHLQELKGRFFWVAIAFVVASGVAYPNFNVIMHVLTAPLGKQELYYMTPAGGLSFVIKVCMYVGAIGILPVIIYQLYRFVTPVMKKGTARAIMGYTIMSTLLAMGGIAFAYFVTLPAALGFLTSININQVSSMLTLDAYMSFVISYVLAGAMLFQTPLIMMLINSVTPLPVKKLMGFQRHMIVASFIIAAVVSPTPDVVNQTILAAPMVAMYQVGIVGVWLRNRKRQKANRQPLIATEEVADDLPVEELVKATPAATTTDNMLFADDNDGFDIDSLFREEIEAEKASTAELVSQSVMSEPEPQTYSEPPVQETAVVTSETVSVAEPAVVAEAEVSQPVVETVQPAVVPQQSAQPQPAQRHDIGRVRMVDGIRAAGAVSRRPVTGVPARAALSHSMRLAAMQGGERRRTVDGFVIPAA